MNRFCPSNRPVSLSQGDLSCGEDIDSSAKMWKSAKDAEATKRWFIRILSFLAFWCTVSACLQPIKSVLGLIANAADSATECIPCVGGCVDLLTDIFMGVVKVILCIVSFCCGGAMFLTVAVIVWIVMRPLWGVLGLCVICCC